MKSTERYWELISSSSSDPECEQFLQLLSCVSRWSGPELPSKIGTVRLRQAVTLLPQQEYVVWGKLPSNAPVSPGSTVIVEPTSARSTPKNILVGRLVTPMWGDRWIPVKVLNPTHSLVTLRRNAKLADVSPCLAVEDLPITQGLCQTQSDVSGSPTPSKSMLDPVKLLKDHGLADIDIGGCEVSADWKKELAELLLKFQDVFSKAKLDCGEAKDFVHRIHLSDDRPFRLPYRRVPPAHYHHLREVLSEMEMKGIISKSLSEYASPPVMVWKKNGDLRICTDFRLLNAKTVKDAHPLPHQGDCLAALGGNAFFSTMDLTSGFYNVPLHESDRRFTAFTTPLGLYEYNRLPQGLCNSPASFMRMMLSIFGDLNFSSLLCYLDDLLVVAPSEGEALSRLGEVFSRLRANNLKLAQKKCHFLRKSVKFLGHMVDSSGISVDQEKVRVISGFSREDLMKADGCTPSQKRVRSFLGMVLYYQHFIPGCSSIAKPLFALTAGQKRKGRGTGGTRRAGTFRELTPQDWTPVCEKAFDDLKRVLLDCVVLAHPDFDRPFILSTDASLDGLGAVLSQVPAGEEKARPIAFASMSLSRSQANYPAHRLEFLALKWSVCDKFSHWLKGHKFTVWTDNNPLTYIMTKPKLDACEQRWVSKLAPYFFEIKHIPGRLNVVADDLSRDPFVKPLSQRLLSEPYSGLLEQVCEVEEGCVQDSFRLTCQPQSLGSVAPCAAVDVSMSEDDVSSLLSSCDDWDSAPRQRAASMSDRLSSLIPPGQDLFSSLSLADLQDHQQQDSVVSRVFIYVDRKQRPSRRERCNESQCTLRVLKQWEKLTILHGVLYRVTRDPLTKHKRFQYILPESLKSQALSGVHDLAGHQGQPRSLSLARDNFFCVYGFPQRLHSDQGANFESELIAELLELADVNKSRTSPYHPMGNGGTERFNRTLGNMLRSLPPRSKQKWPQMVQTMTFVYNCTAHETTGFAPFYLMFGRVPRLPVDLLFKNVLRDETVCDYDAYVKSLASDLHSAILLAQKNSAIEQKHQSDQCNKKVKGLPLSVGDQVLVANKGGRGKRKLADKWEPVVHTVVASKPSLHVYKIRDRDGHERVVHRNLLLQVSFLPLDESLDALGVGSLNDGCPKSDLPECEESAIETDCGSADPTMADSLSWVSDGSDDHTASWVHEQSPVRDEDDNGT
uniref:ribonuclease H n=1 Tax=Gadus morhua TaxID=8049 RepID=A0A8C5BFE2_GADMO